MTTDCSPGHRGDENDENGQALFLSCGHIAYVWPHVRGKSCDTFLPCGPALVTLDEISDLRALLLTTDVDGERRQEAPVADLIFDVPTLVEYITRDITLEPGDIICTGTPAVGGYRKPPTALAAGNVVECAIGGVGVQRNRVVGAT